MNINGSLSPSEDPCVESFIQLCREELHAKNNDNGTKKCTENVPRTDNCNSSDLSESFGYFFFSVAGSDEVVNAFELQQVMEKIFKDDFIDGEEFSLEACRSLISSHDDKLTGNLNYAQFKRLWCDVTKWMNLFKACDVDTNRKIGLPELVEVLKKLDISVKEETVAVLFNRFQNKQGLINLDDFIQLCCKITFAKQKFEKMGADVSLGRFLFDILYS